MKYANLHLHSTYSDGGFTPQQLVLIAKSLGYKAMALTDHETNGGVNELAAAAAVEGILTIPGVEFYGLGWGINFHIVALDFDNDDPGFNAFVKERCDKYINYTQKCVERALKLGLIRDITWNDVLDTCDEGTWICVDQVMRVLRNKHIIPKEGGEAIAALRKEMFRSPEAKSFYPEIPTVERVISVIRKAGGIAAVAHPYQGQTKYVGQLVDFGMNGIEISHPHLYDETPLAEQAAEAYHLYHCGGTDHTGALSCCGGHNAVEALQGVTEEEYLTLIERRLG